MRLADHEFEDRDVVRRFMMNMRIAAPKRYRRMRWAIVSEMTGFGSTVSQALCEEFGLDPWEEIKQ